MAVALKNGFQILQRSRSSLQKILSSLRPFMQWMRNHSDLYRVLPPQGGTQNLK
jgi:hypothetical protein